MVLKKLFRVPAFLAATLLTLSAFGSGLGFLRPDANAAPNPPNLNADFLDSLDSTQFLRSDTSGNYTAGTLTFNIGTIISIEGDLSIADTNIAFTGGDTTFDLNAAAIRTLAIINSDSSNVVNLSVEGNISGDTITSLVETGIAPLFVSSTTKVGNLNADLLDDQTGSYYLDLDNEIGTCTNCLTGLEIDEGGLDHGLFGGLGDDDHPQYLLANGTRSLTSNWDAGSFKITAKQLDLNSGSTTDTLYLSAEAPKIIVTSTDNSSGIRLDVVGTASQLLRLQYNGSTKFSFWTTGVSELGTIENSTFDTNYNLFKTPAFRARKSATSGPYSNEAQTVGTDVEEYDYGNNFTNYNFIAPFDGVYHFDGTAFLGSLSDAGSVNLIYLRVNGVKKAESRIGNFDAPNGISLTISTDLLLNAGDAVRLTISSTDSSFNIGGLSSNVYSYFSGRLVVRDN